MVKASLTGLCKLAAGGTAVGTGINTLPDFGPKIAVEMAALTGQPFVTAPHKFAAQGSLDAMVNAGARRAALAMALMKTANDLRWLGSGPRCGLHELNLPPPTSPAIWSSLPLTASPVRRRGWRCCWRFRSSSWCPLWRDCWRPAWARSDAPRCGRSCCCNSCCSSDSVPSV